MQRQSLKANILAMYMLQVSNYAIPLVTLPYLIRTLGATNYGLMAFAAAITYVMVLFIDSGYNLMAVRALSALHGEKNAKEKTKEISKIFWLTQITKTLLAMCCLGTLILLVFFIPKLKIDASIYFVSFLTVFGTIAFPVWLFQGLEQMRLITTFNVAGRLLATLGIFILVQQPEDHLKAAFLQSSATLASGAMAFLFLKKKSPVEWHWAGWSEVYDYFKSGKNYFISDFFNSIFNNIPVLILGIHASKEIVGIFSALEKVIRSFLSLFSPFQRAIFPKAVSAYKHSFVSGFGIFKRSLLATTVTSVFIAIGLFFTSDAIIQFLFKSHGVLSTGIDSNNPITLNTISHQSKSITFFILACWFVFSSINSVITELLFLAAGFLKNISYYQNISNVLLAVGYVLFIFFENATKLANTNRMQEMAILMLCSQIFLFLFLVYSTCKIKSEKIKTIN